MVNLFLLVKETFLLVVVGFVGWASFARPMMSRDASNGSNGLFLETSSFTA